tara:strand:+ start:98 stop:607 length:510 start_codon:yes stop_codon:yes gene_type:complete
MIKKINYIIMNVDVGKLYSDLWDEVLYTIGMRYTDDLQTAEDLCQNGWIKVFEKIEMWDNIGCVEGWIKKVIKNSILDELRKKDNINREINIDEIEVFDTTYVKLEFEGIDVVEASKHLSKSLKVVFGLYLDGYTHKQMAEELGVCIGTTKSNLHKAKKKIREILNSTI